MPTSSGRERILYLAGLVFLVLVGSYFVRKVFLPNPEIVDNSPVSPPPAVAEDGKVDSEPIIHVETSTTAAANIPAPTDAGSIPQQEHSGSVLPAPPKQPDGSDHTVIYSGMTKDGKWFPIDFGDYGSYNPNLIPHPFHADSWYMVAQGLQPTGESDRPSPVYSLELVCEAHFVGGVMRCKKSPISVPIASTVSDKCVGSLSWFNYFIGPNDPRVFFGPDRPYITYGSASQYTCLGQWIHDLRRLVRWNTLDALDTTQRFFFPTELQRPPPYGDIEKNWFAFWDAAGEMYLHYDILPHRTFAHVSTDGTTIGANLAPETAARDDRCLQQHLASRLREKEHVHQATNSLAIVMCRRDDFTCDAAQNTYIAAIVQHKTYHGHNLYEPYLVLFENTAPFALHAISAKPYWINGRGKPGEDWSGDPDIPRDWSQMMYITSMNWKDEGLNYTGYLDDAIMIAFGIEDKAAGGIDVTAEQLVKELSLCT